MIDSLDNNYAFALFSIAKEDKALDKYTKEIREIKKLFLENSNLLNLLKSEFIPLNERYKSVDKIFTKKYSKNVINFIKVLIQNHRIASYLSIFNAFISLVNQENNVLEGIIYSTVKLEEDKIKEIEKAFEEKNGIKVDLTNKIDLSLIGGIKVIINNHIYDYSIANELNSLANKLKA